MHLSAIVPVNNTPSEWALFKALEQQLYFLGADEVLVDSAPGGCAMARNRASLKAKGDVLLFIDADTWPVAPMNSYAKACYDGSFSFWQPISWVNKTNSKYTELSCRVLTFFSWLNLPTPIVAVAIRRELFERIGRWDETVVYEDWELGRVLGENGYKPGKLPGYLELHRKWYWHDASHASTRTYFKKFKYR